MFNNSEICPATGETCVFVAEVQKLYTGNRESVDHATGSHDFDLYTGIMSDHAVLLEKSGDTTGPDAQGKCPLHESTGKRAVGHLIGGLQTRPHAI